MFRLLSYLSEKELPPKKQLNIDAVSYHDF